MRPVLVHRVLLVGCITQVSCISFDEVFIDSKEKYEAIKEDDTVQKGVAKTQEGVEQVKEGIETVKKVKRGVENTIEFAQSQIEWMCKLLQPLPSRGRSSGLH